MINQEKEQIKKHNKLKIKRELKLLKQIENDIKKNMDEMEKEITKIINKYNNESPEWSYEELKKYNRLDKINKEVEKEVKKKKKKEYAMIITFLTINTKNNIKDISKLTNKEVKISKKEINKIIQAQWFGSTISERHNKNTMNFILKIKEKINLPLIRAKKVKTLEDIKDSTVRLKERINKEKTIRMISYEINKNAKASFQLADTENTHIAYKVVDKVGKKGKTILLYNAVLDDVTCKECYEYHEKKFSYGYEPSLPVHPNCRCFYTVIEK